jgi:hypothetical protein
MNPSPIRVPPVVTLFKIMGDFWLSGDAFGSGILHFYGKDSILLDFILS